MNNTTLIDVCADFVRYNLEENALTVMNDDGKPVTFNRGAFRFDDVDKLHEGENFLFQAPAWLAELQGL